MVHYVRTDTFYHSAQNVHVQDCRFSINEGKCVMVHMTVDQDAVKLILEEACPHYILGNRQDCYSMQVLHEDKMCRIRVTSRFDLCIFHLCHYQTAEHRSHNQKHVFQSSQLCYCDVGDPRPTGLLVLPQVEASFLEI